MKCLMHNANIEYTYSVIRPVYIKQLPPSNTFYDLVCFKQTELCTYAFSPYDGEFKIVFSTVLSVICVKQIRLPNRLTPLSCSEVKRTKFDR